MSQFSSFNIDIDDDHDSRSMSDFEDHNPFRADNDDVHSEPETNSNVDLSSEPDTPPAHPSRILASPPTSPGVNREFSPAQILKPASFRPPPQVYKSDFCCARDRWLHSGEDVEIQVRASSVSRPSDALIPNNIRLLMHRKRRSTLLLHTSSTL